MVYQNDEYAHIRYYLFFIHIRLFFSIGFNRISLHFHWFSMPYTISNPLSTFAMSSGRDQ